MARRLAFAAPLQLALLLSLLPTTLATPSSSSSTPPPTTPNMVPSLPAPPTEACLAPPSAQAANRRYDRWVAYCQRSTTTRPVNSATDPVAEGTDPEPVERTSYNEEEVAARRAGARADWNGWDDYTAPPVVDFDDVVDALGGEWDETNEMEMNINDGGNVVVDRGYADFLRTVEGPAAARVEGGGWTTPQVPDQVLPLLVGAVWLLARVAGVGSRNRGAMDGAEAKHRIRRR
ncbi:hypothetical protein T439DRAFT_321428 [Meredithblackwellia eburnea MCA 4105]